MLRSTIEQYQQAQVDQVLGTTKIGLKELFHAFIKNPSPTLPLLSLILSSCKPVQAEPLIPVTDPETATPHVLYNPTLTSTLEPTQTPTSTPESTPTPKVTATETAVPEPEQKLLFDGQQVKWWNKDTKEFEVLDHIKPEMMVSQENELNTAVFNSKGINYPVVVVDTKNGEMKRGDIGFDRGILDSKWVNMGGNWFEWNGEQTQWILIEDQQKTEYLDLGLPPDRTYTEQTVNGKVYLVDTYNGALAAEKSSTGWSAVTDPSIKYQKYSNSLPPMLAPKESILHTDFDDKLSTTFKVGGVVVDFKDPQPFYSLSLGQFDMIYMTEILYGEDGTYNLLNAAYYSDLAFSPAFGKYVKQPAGYAVKFVSESVEETQRLIRPGEGVHVLVEYNFKNNTDLPIVKVFTDYDKYTKNNALELLQQLKLGISYSNRPLKTLDICASSIMLSEDW